MTPSEIAFDDQWRAASAAASAIISSSAAAHGFPIHHQDDWITERFRDFHLKCQNGEIHYCAHITSSPRPAHTAAWATNILVCTDCTGFLKPEGPKATCCDRCGTDEDNLYGSFAASGPIIMAYALCEACARAAQQSGR
ncbi:hypothetical protein LO762_26215 [Actinocorallia sp. API 0066]|uniref:hypothetical protein n=1 Tax=Actinocorallia sp. API 0066 TaxID=2896846 RepID=UPI001E465829|nr:hypothetical protein [Actinocorallia sp. API 0066]MCD0452651.1 hypothetical protein [Actinocorallia sp. API 0066]